GAAPAHPRGRPARGRAPVRGAGVPRHVGRRHRHGVRDQRTGALQALPEQGRAARPLAGRHQRAAA
ncbi:MAG: Transcriptional regulator, AcrR family, partial [uncultured Solirubrobacteraceae bacterium]